MAGRGWAWTAYDWDEQRLFNYVGDAQNTFPVWNATPLVALDVYEHAYFLDYQTDRGSYIDAFFENLDWGVVNELGRAVPDPGLAPAWRWRAVSAPRLIAAGYLIGSLPWGYWLPRSSRGSTSAPSGAATPARRTSGGRSASSSGSPSRCSTSRKGAAAALLGRWLADDLVGVLAGVAAMVGHCRPLFLRLRPRRKIGRDDGRRRARARAVSRHSAAAGRLDRRVPRDPLRLGRVDGRRRATLPLFALALRRLVPVVVFTAAAARSRSLLHRANIPRLARGTEHKHRAAPHAAAPAR